MNKIISNHSFLKKKILKNILFEKNRSKDFLKYKYDEKKINFPIVI